MDEAQGKMGDLAGWALDNPLAAATVLALAVLTVALVVLLREGGRY